MNSFPLRPRALEANRRRSWLLCAAILLLSVLMARPAGAALTDPATALRDYVRAPDSAYSYTPVSSIVQGDLAIHVLSLTSQQWRSSSEVDRVLWQHWLVILVPSQVRSSTAALIIGSGRNNGLPPSLTSTDIGIGAQLARASGTVVAVLGQAPNQPLTPADLGTPLVEDALVAYSWRKAMDTGDWGWSVHLPMVKSAVRAMDTVQAVAPGIASGVALDRFVAIGFSKRGAATWLTAAVDPRVVAMAPGVYDALNLASQFELHFESLGSYGDAMVDYLQYGIPRRLRSPEGRDLLQVIDPYSYRRMLAVPKFLIHSSGDQFFMPDSGRFYQRDLAGETLVRHVPNTDHSLSSSAGITDVLTSLVAWYQRVVADVARPQIRSFVERGKLHVHSSPRAAAARVWEATNNSGRDFRRVTTGEIWRSAALVDQGVGGVSAFVVPLDAAPAGATARFVELSFVDDAGLPQTYSTRIEISPGATQYEVVDAVRRPRSVQYWRRQVEAALGAPGGGEIDASTLRSYLPAPLFNDHVATLEAARQILRPQGSARALARQQCLATRMNIATGALGWYSPVQLLGVTNRSLWWFYQQADTAFGQGAPSIAWVLCAGLNTLQAREVQAQTPVQLSQ